MNDASDYEKAALVRSRKNYDDDVLIRLRSVHLRLKSAGAEQLELEGREVKLLSNKELELNAEIDDLDEIYLRCIWFSCQNKGGAYLLQPETKSAVYHSVKLAYASR